jgi:hypothetical protein
VAPSVDLLKLTVVPGGAEKMQAIVRAHLAMKRVARRHKLGVQRRRVVHEMLLTERSYCASLETLRSVVIEPLRWSAQTSPTPILSHTDLRSIFCNVSSGGWL